MPIDPRSAALVVVTFFPDEDFFERFARLSKPFACGLIIDNGSTPAQQGALQQLTQTGANVLISNSRNEGLAYALNQGLAEAKKRGLTWALLMDQDTDFEDGLWSAYEQALAADPAPAKVALIGSNYLNQVGEQSIPLLAWRQESPHAHAAKAVITAGSLIAIDTFYAIGRFRADLFIDWVDTEYSYRARQAGFKVLMLNRPLIRQKIGQTRRIDSPLGAVYASNHSPLRRYYMMRNLILLLKDYAFFEPVWFMGRLGDAAKTAAKILFYEDQKSAKLGAMGRGIIDGCLNRQPAI